MELKKQPRELRVSTRFSGSQAETHKRNNFFLFNALLVFSFFIWAVTATEFWIQARKQWSESETRQQHLQRRLHLMRATVENLAGKNKNLTERLKKKTAAITQLAGERQLAEQRVSFLSARYSGLQEDFLTLWERYKEIKAAQTLSNFHKDPAPAVWEKRGKVLEINPVYGFAVVNAGRQAGLREGQILLIARNHSFLEGILTVERVYENLSACAVSFKDPSQSLLPGDEIFAGKIPD